MARQPNKSPMTPSEMALEARMQTESKVYGGRGQTVEANRNVISEIVGNMAEQMEAAADQSRRFDLSDLEKVDETARAYVMACADAGTLPTVAGAAAAMGRSRTAVYKFADTHRAFSDWLVDFSDSCGEAAAAAAIHGAVSAIPAIFTLKARHGWRDVQTVEIGPANHGPLGDEADAAEIAARYADLPSD